MTGSDQAPSLYQQIAMRGAKTVPNFGGVLSFPDVIWVLQSAELRELRPVFLWPRTMDEMAWHGKHWGHSCRVRGAAAFPYFFCTAIKHIIAIDCALRQLLCPIRPSSRQEKEATWI